jgi:hypothetical protein
MIVAVNSASQAANRRAKKQAVEQRRFATVAE